MDKRIIAGLVLLGFMGSGLFFIIGTVLGGLSPVYTIPVGVIAGVLSPFVAES